MNGRRTTGALTALLLLLSASQLLTALAAPVTNPSFQNVWARTDRPIIESHVNRTWLWGPEAFTEPLLEPYAEAPGGQRWVQYFDKSRMEITNPKGERDSDWFVTNGLLATELISGRLQLGQDTFAEHAPAQINVAGDQTDANAPTYASFAGLLDGTAGHETAITRVLRRDGTLGSDEELGSFGIGAAIFAGETQHWIATPFWDFMTSAGTVYQQGQFTTAPLFENPYYATGYPITDAVWAEVQVGGALKWVLIQCFERRCLTYTPDNADGWRVETGNVGLHYYHWRYEQLGMERVAAPLIDNIDYNCSDFSTHAEAQAYFDSQGGSASNNIDGLDNNKNGLVCESLP